MDPKIITPILIAGAIVWAIYRRMRRTFGRQRVSVTRIWIRIGILSLVGGLLLFTSLHNAPVFEALLAGVACGLALGYLGLRHTQFEATPQGNFYTPHTYIGLTVSALFLGRLLYRFLTLNYGAQSSAPGSQNALDAYQRSPVTMVIFGVLVGYYVLFNLGVLQKFKLLATPP